MKVTRSRKEHVVTRPFEEHVVTMGFCRDCVIDSKGRLKILDGLSNLLTQILKLIKGYRTSNV